MKRIDPVLVWLGLVVLFFSDLLFRPVAVFGRDVNSYFLPLESAVHRAWAGGRLPLWFSEVSGGKPLLPNPNAGVFYPLRIASAALPFPYAFKLYLVVHVFLAGWGAMRLARDLGASRGGQLVAAIAYALSGPALTAVLFPSLLPGFALLPWSAAAALGLSRAPSLRRVAFLAAIFTLDLLAGEPFTVALALAGAAALAATAIPGNRGRAMAGVGAALAMAFLAAAVQFVPTLLYLPATFRAQAQFRWLGVLQWSLSPARLLEWVVPYPFGDPTGFVAANTWGGRFFDWHPSGLFATIFAGVFATVALLDPRVRLEDRRAARGLGLLFGASILLAGAACVFPHRYLGSAAFLPLRYPEKFVFGAILVAAIFAGRAWDVAPGRRRWPWIFAAFGLSLATLALLARAGGERTAHLVISWTQSGMADRTGDHARSFARLLSEALAEGALHWAIALAAAAVLVFGGRRPLAQVLALLLVAADLALATRRIVPTAPERDVFAPPPAITALRALDPEARFCFVPQAKYFPIAATLDPQRGRLPDRPPEIALRAFAGSMWGRPSVLNSDPDASDLAGHAFARRDLFEVLASAPGRAANFLAGYSVAYLVRFPDAPPIPGSIPAARAGGVVIDRLPGAVPRVSLARRWEEFPSASPAEKALREGAIPPETAVLETGRSAAGEDAEGTIDSVFEENDRFSANVSCPSGCWLRRTQGFWRFREIRIDGSPAAAVPERTALSAVRVPPGRHRIVWRERVPGGASGLAASLAGIAAIATMALRRPRVAPDPSGT